MSRGEASGENKGPGPPGTALGESVVYQCLCMHVCVLIYARDSKCGDRDPGAARETECLSPVAGGNPCYTYE